jgi:hypothetical protein
MPSGSYIDAGILTASVQPLTIFYSASMTSQKLTTNVNSSILYLLTYPVTIGYSGSVVREITQLPTQSIGGGVVVPTIGQIWPRGNRQ